MKSVAGAIVVLAGAVIMGLAHEDIGNDHGVTLASLGLMIIGLIIVFAGMKSASPGKKE